MRILCQCMLQKNCARFLIGVFYACNRCQLPSLGISVVIMDHFLLINQEIAMGRTAM